MSDATALERGGGPEPCSGLCTSATAELVGGLIDGTWSNEARLEWSIRRLGIDFRCRWVLVLLTASDACSDVDFEVDALAVLARQSFSVSLVGRVRAMPARHVPLLVPVPRDHHSADRVLDAWVGPTPDDGVLVVLPDAVCERSELPEVYRAQVDALPCARACAEQVGAVVRPVDFAVYRLLRAVPASRREEFLRSVMGPVLDLSTTKSQQLLGTLDAYFRGCGRIDEASAELDLHRNTFRYRVTRAQEVLGVDFGRERDRLRVELALALHRLHEEEAALDDAPLLRAVSARGVEPRARESTPLADSAR